MIAPGTRIDGAITQVAAAFTAAGIDSARLDARLLLQAVTGMSHEQVVLEPGRLLAPHEATHLSELAARRCAREPIARILGERSFWGRSFLVTQDTLDPRPETETLVELALGIADQEQWRGRPIRVLDIGTGTGCILLTLLMELGRPATGLGTDASPAALAVARTNAACLGLDDRASWLLETGLAALPGRFDLVVSNPPYIPTAEIAALDPEVRCFDPGLALDGGADGLDIIREIVSWSASQPHAWFALEHGAGQSPAVVGLIEASCGTVVAAQARRMLDLGGHTRCVAWKPQS